MTLPSNVTLTPGRRVGGLLQAANPLGGEWRRGLYVDSNQCYAPTRLGPCDTGDVEPQPHEDVHRFDPAVIRQIIACSRLSGTGLAEFATAAAEVTLEYALALELFDGAATTNPNLGDAVEVDNALDLIDAIACLEAVAAQGLTGRVAFIHVPQGMSIYLPDNVQRDGLGQLRTPAGNVVVVSPGYSGQSIYVTGEVWVATDLYDTLTDLNRQDNTQIAAADALALAVFDPCFLYSAATTHVPCQIPDPESPGA